MFLSVESAHSRSTANIKYVIFFSWTKIQHLVSVNQGRSSFFLKRTTVVGSKFQNSYELVRHQAKHQAEVLHTVVDKVLQEVLNLVDLMKFQDEEILKNIETYIQDLDPLAARIDGSLDNREERAICKRDESFLMKNLFHLRKYTSGHQYFWKICYVLRK